MKLEEYIKIIYYNIIFTYKIHIKWLPKKNAILENLIMPVIRGIFYVLVANYISSGAIIYYITGTLCFTAVDSNIGGVSTLISSERRFGTLHTTITSIYNPVFLFLGRIIYWCIIGYIRFLSTYFVLFTIFLPEQMKLNTFFIYSIIYFFICLSLSGIGYLMGIIGMAKRNIMGISNVISTLLLLISGVYFNYDVLPVFIQWCHYLSPLYYGIELCRNVILYQIYNTVFQDILMMLVLGSAYMLIGIFSFKKIEHSILKESQLNNF